MSTPTETDERTFAFIVGHPDGTYRRVFQSVPPITNDPYGAASNRARVLVYESAESEGFTPVFVHGDGEQYDRSTPRAERCAGCGAYSGHSPECPEASEAYLATQTLRYFRAYNEQEEKWHKRAQRTSALLRRYRQDVEFWQGKFNAVRHENNKLRAQLRAHAAENKPSDP